jgi:hypothetical protein
MPHSSFFSERKGAKREKKNRAGQNRKWQIKVRKETIGQEKEGGKKGGQRRSRREGRTDGRTEGKTEGRDLEDTP